MDTQSLSEAIQEENRRIRLLRITTDLVVQILLTGRMNHEESLELINGVRSFALKLFPGKEDVFDLIYLPRFRRALREAGYVQKYKLTVVK